MKISVLIFLMAILSACSKLPVPDLSQSPIVLTVTPNSNTSVAPTQIISQSTYNSLKYGYSLNYPSTFNITIVSEEYVEIGDKITIEVTNIDPTAPRGDGAIIESTSDIQFSGYPAKLSTGYIGSVSGYIPQQFKKIIVERNDNYFVITLYALGLHVTNGDISQITQLTADDVSLFDNITASIRIP